MLDEIMALIRQMWHWVKRIFLRILNFFTNIANWFQNKERLRILEEDQNRIAVAIKENLDNGNYNVVKCLYNKRTNSIEGKENGHFESNEAQEIDYETKKNFGNKNMIIIE